MNSAREYIDLPASQGRFASSGTITIDPIAMLAKVAQYQLPDDVAMLLKLIQGCVGLGAKEIWIETESQLLSLYCRHPNLGEVGALLLGSLSRLPLKDEPAVDIAIGLVHRLGDRPQSLGLSCWQEGQLVQWTALRGSAPAQLATSPWTSASGFGIHLVLEAGSRPLALEAETWQSRVFYAPVPIHFQSHLLGWASETPCPNQCLLEYLRTGIDPTQGSVGARWRGPCHLPLGAKIYHGIEVPGGGDGGRTMSARSDVRFIGSGPEDCSSPATFEAEIKELRESLQLIWEGATRAAGQLKPTEPVPYCNGVVYLYPPGPERLQKVIILPIKRGVVLEPIEMEMPTPMAIVLLPCDEMATDLSQQIIAKVYWPDLAAHAYGLLREAMQICIANKEKIHDLDYLREDSTTLGFVALGLGAAVLGPTPLEKTAGLLVAGAASLYHKFGGGARKEALLRRELAELTQALSQAPVLDPCPACSISMEATSFGRSCPNCGGRMLEEGQAGGVGKQQSGVPGNLPANLIKRGERLCPHCHVRLDSGAQGQETCPLCQGIFIGGGA